ncbi:MAG: response regulator, partial [Bacteroidales bacterium]|nr:response regulator [Bacteroidales bacterium]
MKILIIDDEKSIRYSMRDIIEYEGHSVEEAVDGKNGLDMILKNEYDLVFCDIKMPKMDGIEVLSKSMEAKEVNFCMISGHGTIETAVECLKKGAIDYIEKPIDLNKLISILNENSPSTVIERNENNKVNKAKVSKEKSNNNVFDSIIGQSKPMKEMFGFIEKVG